MSSSNPVGWSKVLRQSGQRILDGGPRYFDTISRHSFSLLYFEQNRHHKFEYLTLLNDAVHKYSLVHFVIFIIKLNDY